MAFLRPTIAPRRACTAVAVAASLLAVGHAAAADIEDGCEGQKVSWQLGQSDAAPRIKAHLRSGETPHRGAACERFIIEASAGTMLRVQRPLGSVAAIDELAARVWVRANRPDIRVGLAVQLPGFRTADGRPVVVIVPGSVSDDVDRWQMLEVRGVPAALRRRLPALHAEHGPRGTLAGAVVTHVVLDLYSSPGTYEVAIDDLAVSGAIAAEAVGTATAKHDPDVQPATAAAPLPPVVNQPAVRAAPIPPADPAPAATAPPSGLTRGVLEVGGLPFFPRALQYNGEPLDRIATLGFNAVWLQQPAGGDLLEEAQRNDMWIICPPPALPDVDVRDPESLPVFSANWDRVLMWDMGHGLAEVDVEGLAERGRRVRSCDQRSGRPLIASADSGLRSVSRHVDMLVARRTVLGTSLELPDYLDWLRERPRLMRPGTPLLATLSTEIDPRTARQAAALAGVGATGLAVDPESLALAAMAAVAAGSRGLLFTSSRRIDGDDAESRARAVGSQAMNLRLELLEPWAAAGRFASVGQASDPEVQSVVLEAARARMVVAWRSVQGAQIVPRHYHGDIPQDSDPVTILVPGVPEAHQTWEVSVGGLKPLKSRRVTGGVSVVLESMRSHAFVLVSGDPAVTAHVQERLRELTPLTIASVRSQAALALARGAELLGRLPPAALGNLPAAAMLSAAQRDAADGEALLASDPATAVAKLQRAIAIASQVERLTWERGVVATGSMVASPLSTSDATLAEHWHFIDALGATGAGPDLVPGGAMERIEDLAGNGWRNFAVDDPAIRTAAEISRAKPHGGNGCLVIKAFASNPAEPPVVVETPPVWITTPPITAPPGKLIEIEARVAVAESIKGSVDGLLVFDSIGGPALAERVGKTKAWQRLVLYRIVPADTTEPLVVTFALSGLGEARLDDVRIRVIERAPGGTPAAIVSTPAGSESGQGFPKPSDLLAPTKMPTLQLPTASAPPEAAAQPPAPLPPSQQWPGMNLEWPKLLPFPSSTAPPDGPGGGKIDPFKRARGP
jgi:hypothetical protein